MMKVGDTVKYFESQKYKYLTGKVKIIHGRKWLTIGWSDNVNLREHVDDLIFSREGRRS